MSVLQTQLWVKFYRFIRIELRTAQTFLSLNISRFIQASLFKIPGLLKDFPTVFKD